MSDLRNDQINALGREVTDLRAANTRLQAAVDSVSADARARCAERDAAIAENTRQAEELERLTAALREATEFGFDQQRSFEEESLKNTPLRERLALVEPVLNDVADVLRDALNALGRCTRAGDSWSGEGDHRRRVAQACSDVRARVLRLRGDVTTSDKAPFCNPALEHVFKPAPFYPEQCDVKLDADGRPRTCARPRSEHGS